MSGTILDVIDGGSIWLLIVNTGNRIAEQVIEPRYMFDIVAGEGLESPAELVGREIEVSEDGMAIGLPRMERRGPPLSPTPSSRTRRSSDEVMT